MPRPSAVTLDDGPLDRPATVSSPARAVVLVAGVEPDVGTAGSLRVRPAEHGRQDLAHDPAPSLATSTPGTTSPPPSRCRNVSTITALSAGNNDAPAASNAARNANTTISA